jgi:hypothetical protein
LLPIAACGALLSDAPNLVSASTEHARSLVTLEQRGALGPATQSLTSASVVSCPDLAALSDRWPAVAAAALEYGLRAADGLPMRLRDQTIGSLTLYRTETGTLDDSAAELAKAIADVATIGIVHQRVLHRNQILTQQLQTALDSRVVIEQAKGRIAERLQVAIDEAFLTLRRYARNNNMRLSDAARAVAEGTLDIDPALVPSPSVPVRPCPHVPIFLYFSTVYPCDFSNSARIRKRFSISWRCPIAVPTGGWPWRDSSRTGSSIRWCRRRHWWRRSSRWPGRTGDAPG